MSRTFSNLLVKCCQKKQEFLDRINRIEDLLARLPGGIKMLFLIHLLILLILSKNSFLYWVVVKAHVRILKIVSKHKALLENF